MPERSLLRFAICIRARQAKEDSGYADKSDDGVNQFLRTPQSNKLDHDGSRRGKEHEQAKLEDEARFEFGQFVTVPRGDGIFGLQLRGPAR